MEIMKSSKFKNKTTKEVFTEIYINNEFKSLETISGEGSEIAQTKSLIKDLEITTVRLLIFENAVTC